MAESELNSSSVSMTEMQCSPGRMATTKCPFVLHLIQNVLHSNSVHSLKDTYQINLLRRHGLII